ncbi:MAG: carbohydrate ABC transporter substrate-binding protein, partial [Actinomycetota bacterium]
VDNDCLMQRQASFAAGQFPEGTNFADPSDPEAIDAFYFPSNEGRPLLGAGVLAAAFADRPEVWAVMDYISGPDYAANRQQFQTAAAGGGNSGFLSAVNGLDQSVFNGLEQSFLAILASADVVRFDGSDLMPADVGAGTFWTEGTSAINGDQDAAEAADKIEASWP